MLYLQLAMFPVLAVAGIWGGLALARKRWWWVGVVGAMVVIGLVMIGHRSSRAVFMPVIGWVVDVDWNAPLMTVVVGVVFATLLPKLPRRQTRVLVATCMMLMMVYYGLLPSLMPLVVRGSLRSTPTVINSQGVCLQQHHYTCGPAAAVTCLRQLGVMAEEGPLAVEARCGPAVGTDGKALARAVEGMATEVKCTYRYVEVPEDLRMPAVVDVVMPLVGGHYIAVLGVKAEGVVVGDPLSGLSVMPRAEFMAVWQHTAVEMGRR